jgi:hypothetical protein
MLSIIGRKTTIAILLVLATSAGGLLGVGAVARWQMEGARAQISG